MERRTAILVGKFGTYYPGMLRGKLQIEYVRTAIHVLKMCTRDHKMYQ